MKHRIYIAAPSEYWDRAHIFANELVTELGDAEVVSRWHERPILKYPEREDVRAVQVDMNVNGLERANVTVALCDAGVPRTTFADVGYALGRGVPVVWVKGEMPTQQCLMDAHRLVRVVDPQRDSLKDLAARIARIIEREMGIS